MITVHNLSKIYRTHVKSGTFPLNLLAQNFEEKNALKKISFDIGEGELVGFIGPNGAGKTTTMKILSGVLYPTSGEVNVLGYVPFDKNHAFLKQIGFVMGQKNQLLWELPAEDSFELYKEIYEIDDATYRKTTNELISLLKVSELLKQPIKTLSLGQRMRMELIASLLHKPKILFLDEPTIGLDIFAQTVIRNFIREYQGRHNATIILTSHYMQDVQELAKRVLVINDGEIIFDGALEKLISTFSNEKTVVITLTRPLSTDSLKQYIVSYDYPVLTLELPKKKLDVTLPKMLQSLEFSDLTIEDEPIEDVIKKVFKK